MNPMRGLKRLLFPLAALLMLAALVSVACGEDSTATPRPTNTPAPVQPTDTPVPTAVPTEAPAMPGPPADERGGVVPLMSFGSPQTGIAGFGGTLLTGASHEVPLTNSLLHLDPETPDPVDLGGDLATEWSVSDDGLIYTFKLHEGIVSRMRVSL